MKSIKKYIALLSLTAIFILSSAADTKSWKAVATEMQGILDEATDPWGIKVGRVELKNIIPPEEIQRSMEKQMKAERDRRETLLEAEGHKQASITRAEGDKQALVLKAEAERDAAIARATGQAESIRLVYEAEARGIEMLKEANIDVPTDLASAAADLTFKTEMLGFGNNTPVDKSTDKKAATKAEDPCCSESDKGATTKHFVEDHVNFEQI